MILLLDLASEITPANKNLCMREVFLNYTEEINFDEWRIPKMRSFSMLHLQDLDFRKPFSNMFPIQHHLVFQPHK